ncbi:MAG: TIGR03862 family flavoprotein [Pseudomonadota bacterium]|nr:TIGR03862 family flavoprotein [Pseudomonadota bacterium]
MRDESPFVAVIGGGPAGLMAAETVVRAGHRVQVFDEMPSVGRKFLLAGIGGLNLTHSEGFDAFVGRYRERASVLRPRLEAFDADALRDWAAALGVETFVGTSGRVFPRDLKAAPLLRTWLHRLREQGVVFRMRHRWLGFGEGNALRLQSPSGELLIEPAATVLALGGASWPQLGSDGSWVAPLVERQVDIAPLRPANCGFDVAWSEHFSQRHAGEPLKSVAVEVNGQRQAGEFVVTAGGVEGSLIYAVSALLRDQIERTGEGRFQLDLLPQRSLDWVRAELAHPRGPRSLSTHLKTRLKLAGAKAGLLWELVPKEVQTEPERFAEQIKSLTLTVKAPRPIAEAISSAGGVRFEALDDHLMAHRLPGVFCAGEMLDWEAPTGGYLLGACFATGARAGQGAAAWVTSHGT